MNLVKNVKQTRYAVCDAFSALKKRWSRNIPAGCRTNQHDLKANAHWFTLVSAIAEGFAYKMSAYEVCMICPKRIVACKIHCKSPSWRLDGLTTLRSTGSRSMKRAFGLILGNQHMCGAGSGQLVPKTTRTQDNLYPRLLVPSTTRTQVKSYPSQLAPKTTRTQDNSYPGQLVPKTTRTWVTLCPGQLVPMTIHTQDNSYSGQLIPKTVSTQGMSYPRQLIHGNSHRPNHNYTNTHG